jgi:hypothetical protein
LIREFPFFELSVYTAERRIKNGENKKRINGIKRKKREDKKRECIERERGGLPVKLTL